MAGLPETHHLKPNMSRRGNCHDNPIAENFFSYLSENESSNGSTQHAQKHDNMFSITLKCFITQLENMATLITYLQSTLKIAVKQAVECLRKAGRFSCYDNVAA